MSYINTCATAIVGTWVERLQDVILQHMPKFIRNRTAQERKQPQRQDKSVNSVPYCDSSIGNHLLYSQKCTSHYNDDQFFILSKARL